MAVEPMSKNYHPPEYTAEQWAGMKRAAEALNYGVPEEAFRNIVCEAVPRAPPPAPPRPAFTLPVPVVPETLRHQPVVYLIKCGDYIKIGTTGSIETRFRLLLGATPYDLELVAIFKGSYKLERELQQHFAACRHRDEWFRIEGELAEWLDDLRARKN
jgi:hypothetical protein